jgi:hypothetical protein
MLLVRRRILSAVTTEKPKETSVPASKRRQVIAGSATDLFQRTEKVKIEVERQLKSISDAYAAIDQAQAAAETAMKIVEAQLRSVNLKSHSDGMYVAELAEVWTRQSTKIDPKKFRAHVEADVFWESIKVSIEKAKEYLSEKELVGISDIEPSKLTGVFLKVNKVKRPKK